MSGASPGRRRASTRARTTASIATAGVLAAAAVTGVVVLRQTGSADTLAPRADATVMAGTTRPRHEATPQRIDPGRRLRAYSRSELAARRAEQAARARAALAARRARMSVSFTLGTLNVLGSQHTGPQGNQDPGWPSAAWRTPREAAAILSHGTDVVGLQEAQPDQLNGLLAATGFRAYPGYAFGAGNTDNSILYDPRRFAFVSGTSFPITFMHAVRPQTVLELRDRRTGRRMYFLNLHTSAHRDAHDTATRYAGMARLVSYLGGLRATGLPIFVTGDMNDREQFRLRVQHPAGLVAAIDGGWRDRTFGPGWLAVDWIASTPGVSWSDYWVDPLQARRISDHYFITATATIPGHG